MTNYFLKRTARTVFTIWLVVTLTFWLIRQIPGGPLQMLRARLIRQGVSTTRIEAIMKTKQESSDPIHVEYIDYLGSLLQGNFGQSTFYRQPVSQIITEALPWTVFVMLSATLLIFAIALLWGALMAYYEGTRFDTISSALSILLSSIPFYVLAIFMVIVLSYQHGIFPPRYQTSPGMEPHLSIAFVVDALQHATLPIVSFALTGAGLQALAMRGNSIQVLGEDYVRVARLRGLSDRRIATRYVGRNAILPMYTGFLMLIGFNMGGSIILEEIFSYQGIGYYMFQSLNNRDYPLMMGIFLVITVTLVLSVYIADLTYGYVDPRVKSGDSSEAY